LAFFVYLLRCADGSYYAGHTEDLERRLGEHDLGSFESSYKRKRKPLELVWCADFSTRDEALAYERRIKGWRRAKKEALIAGDWELLRQLAKPRPRSI
jgi:predicted GIY-YIG superfamily endonuclease